MSGYDFHRYLFCFVFFFFGAIRCQSLLSITIRRIVLSEAKLQKKKKTEMYPEYREGQIENRQWFTSEKWHFDDEFLNSCNQRSGRIKLVGFCSTKIYKYMYSNIYYFR